MQALEELTDIVGRLAGASSFQDAAHTLTSWARELTGCEEVILRVLERGEEGLWATACSVEGADASFLRDEAVVEANECFCGRVASGLAHAPGPFLTPGGSFVWGRVSGLVERFGAEAVGAIRGRCMAEGYESVAIFPLVGNDGPLGALHLGDHRPDVFDRHAELLEAAARLAGPILLRQQAQEREAAVLEAVKSTLLPFAPAVPVGLEVGVAFTAAGEIAQLGGDFYDLVDVGGGNVLAMVGDYSGKGLQAAGMAARARYVLIGQVARTKDPAALLNGANDVLAKTLPEGRFVSVATCVVSTDSRLVTVGLAGHPPPLILDKTGTSELPAPPNLPLAAVPGSSFSTADHPLETGQVLLLYTDGVTESRAGGRLFGIEGVARVWASGRWDDLDALAAAICRASAGFHDPALPADDRLVMALRLVV